MHVIIRPARKNFWTNNYLSLIILKDLKIKFQACILTVPYLSIQENINDISELNNFHVNGRKQAEDCQF